MPAGLDSLFEKKILTHELRENKFISSGSFYIVIAFYFEFMSTFHKEITRTVISQSISTTD